MQSLVFNHHSLPFDWEDQAKSAVPDFVKTCLLANQRGFSLIWFGSGVDSSWYRIELSLGYFFKNWLDRADRDLKSAFLRISTKQSYSVHQGSDPDSFDLSFQGAQKENPYEAIRIATSSQYPIVSFPTREPWTRSPLAVTINSLGEERPNIKTRHLEIVNLYCLDVAKDALHKLSKLQSEALRTGKELLSYYHEKDRGIIIFGKAIDTLNRWSLGSKSLQSVKDTLRVLSEFAMAWKDNKIAEYRHEVLAKWGLSHPASDESQTVRNHPKLRKLRTFPLPESGKSVFFQAHIKLTNGLRLHFYPDKENKKIYIGYIGKHLPTKYY